MVDHIGFSSKGKKMFNLNLICEEDTVSNKKRKLPEEFCEEKQCNDKKPKIPVEKQCDDTFYNQARKRVSKFFDYFRPKAV